MGSAADRVKGSRVSVWLDRRTPSRTRRADQPAGLDRDRITAASVRLLDADGLAKFSMRRLAAELDVTAMSLYWYVDTKDDLLELALDSVFGEIPDARGDADWRDRLRQLADEYRRMLVRHCWASALAGRFLNIGPHSALFSYAVCDVIRATGLPPAGRQGAMSAVFQFVYGFGTVEGHFVQRTVESGLSQDEYAERAMSVIRASPELNRARGAFEDVPAGRGGGSAVEEARERDFAFALDLLIAGIEAMCERTAHRGSTGERHRAAAPQ